MKRIILILAVAVAVSVGIGVYMYYLPVKSLKNAKPAASVSATELLAAFENDEEAANTRYLDQIIEVTGIIESVSNEPDQPVQFTLDAGGLLGGVSCVMESGIALDGSPDGFVGKTATIKGSCTGYLMEVILDRCVIVSVN